MKNLILLAALCGLTSCSTVPETVISLPTKYGLFKIVSPKETQWSNVLIELDPDGRTRATIGQVSTHNDANVIATVGAANARMSDSVISLTDKLTRIGEKAATSGVAP